MIEVKLPDAEKHLAQYVDRALKGEDVVIAWGGKAVRLVPVEPATAAHHDEITNEALASIDDREFNHYLG